MKFVKKLILILSNTKILFELKYIFQKYEFNVKEKLHR